MGRIKFLILMAGQAHLDETDGGDFDLIRSFGGLLTKEEVADEQKDKKEPDQGGDEFAGWCHDVCLPVVSS